MSKVNKFIGWAQYTKDEFDKLTFTQKIGRIIFVRDIKDNEITHSQIYFGTRLYAEINDVLNIKVSNIINSLGQISPDGKFKTFNSEINKIIYNATNITDSIILLKWELLKLQEHINKVSERVDNIQIITGDDIL